MKDSGAEMPPRRLRTLVLSALGACLAASALLVTGGLAAGNPDAPDLTGYFPSGNGLTVNAFVDAKTAPGKTLYRFDTVILNSSSAGVLDLYKPAGTLAASQKIWPGGRPPSAPIGRNDVPPGLLRAVGANFTYSSATGHNHWHFPYAAEYQLRDSGGGTVATGVKNEAGFCLFDSWDVAGFTKYFSDGTYCRPGEPGYTGSLRMGIAPGKGDLYPATLYDQWVEVQSIQPRTDYRLWMKVNPRDLIEEFDTANNTTMTSASIIIPGGKANPVSGTTTPGQAVTIPLSGSVVGANVRSRVDATCDLTKANCYTTASTTALTYAIAAAPPAAQGTASVNGANVLFTPASGFSGTATFQYRATDSRGLAGPPATVSVTVGSGGGVTVSVSPSTATVQTGATRQFSATVTGSSATPVWSVNGVTGGNSTVGTVSTSGLYTAPAAVPSGAVTVRATDPGSGAFGTAAVTVSAPTPVTVDVTPATASVQTGATQQFTAAVTGSSATPVWSVNGVTGGNGTVGTISTSGLYTAPGTVPSGAVTVRATDTASGASDTAAVTVTTPGPPSPRDPNGLPLVDAFTGADTGPPPGPAWANTPIWAGQANWKRISNQAGPSGSGWNDAHLSTSFGRPVGIRFQLTTPPPSGGIMFAWLVSSGMGSSPTGYALRLQRGSTDSVALQRWNAGASTNLKTASITPIAAGSWLALIADSTGVEAFRSADGTTWVSLGSSTDTTLPGPLTGGVETISTGTRIDNVGYGQLNSGPPPVTVGVSPSTASVQTGGTQQFTATVTGSSATPVWSVNNIAGGNATVGTISASGLYTAPATVPSGAVTVRATDTASGTAGSAAVTVTPPPPPVTVDVTPPTAAVQTGGTQQFTATVTGSSATPVWSVNGVTGGNGTVGTISTAGLYTAPAAVPSGAVTVRATDTASGVSDTAAVTVTQTPPPVTVDVTPATASVQTGATQQFTAAVTGSGATPVWAVNGITGGNATLGTISASGLYTAPDAVPSGPVTVTATDAASGVNDSAAVTVTLAPPPVTVTVSPASASVATGATRQFTATVTGSTATPVWSVNNVTGGNATVGTVSTSGLYTAPAAVPAGAVTVRATDTASGAAGSASVTVTSGGPAPRDPNLLAVVDTFTGADTGPPPGPLWANTPIWSGQANWKRVSSQAGPSGSGWNDAHLTGAVGRPVGIRLQITTPPPSGGIMFTWLVSSGLGSSPSGYALRLQRGGTDLLQVQRWNAGAATTLKSTSVSPIATGSWLALMVDATGVEAFRSTDGTSWVSLGSSTDTTLTGAFSGGVETNSTTTRIDNVGYGAPTGG